MSCHLELTTFPQDQESSQLVVGNLYPYGDMSQPQSSGETNIQYSDVNGGSTRMSPKMQKSPPQPLRPLVKVLACFAAIGGFLFGYDTGVVSGAMILLKKEFGLNTIWQELIVSVTIGAAALSALCGGIFNEKLGRRRVILIASAVFTAGALMMGLTPNKELLLAGRIVVGIGVGLASMTVPMYIAEVAPVHIRGRLVTINNLFITGGQFIAAVVDGAFSYWPWGWRAMLGLAGVPSAIQLIGFLFLPESPRWLVDHGQLEQAKSVLIRTSGLEHWEDQYQQIVEDAENTKRDNAKGSTIIRIFRTPPVLRALIVGCSLQMFQQLAGINTIMYYSATIIRMSGVKDDSTVIWLSAAVAFANFFFTLAGVYLVEKVGRRVLTLSSFTGVAASVLFLALAFLLIARSSPPVDVPSTDKCSVYNTCDACILSDNCGFCYQTVNDTIYNGTCLVADIIHGNQSLSGLCSRSHLLKHESEWAYDYCPSVYSFLSFIGLILYLVFFAPGMGPMPWTINSEIYPQWARSTGNAISSTVNWSFNLLIAMTFLSLTELITRQGAFFLYFGICVLGIIFISVFLPETKGTRLEDIQKLFEKPVCCGSSKVHGLNMNDAGDPDSSEPLLNDAE